LAPQQDIVPPVVRAQLKAIPEYTWLTVLSDETVTGLALGVLEPLPNCPEVLSPQQIAEPVESAAHAWLAPVATFTALV
jgi:hypothetical protein